MILTKLVIVNVAASEGDEPNSGFQLKDEPSDVLMDSFSRLAFMNAHLKADGTL